MFDRSLIPGAAMKFIRKWNGARAPYQFVDEDGAPVGEPIHGIWQALEVKENNEPDSEADRRGAQRTVFKTDPDSPNQPQKGWRLVVDDRTWQVAERPPREGLFFVWPLFWAD